MPLLPSQVQFQTESNAALATSLPGQAHRRIRMQPSADVPAPLIPAQRSSGQGCPTSTCHFPLNAESLALQPALAASSVLRCSALSHTDPSTLVMSRRSAVSATRPAASPHPYAAA